MNWLLVIVLSSLGLVMGILSVLGLTAVKVGGLPLEFWLWLLVAAIMVLVVVKCAEGRSFRHGFLVGMLAALIAPVVQFLFFETYLTNNPNYAEQFAKLTAPRQYVLLQAPVVAVVWGLFVGMLSWVVAKISTRLNRQPTAGAP